MAYSTYKRDSMAKINVKEKEDDTLVDILLDESELFDWAMINPSHVIKLFSDKYVYTERQKRELLIYVMDNFVEASIDSTNQIIH